jgi:integrase
LPDSAGAQLTRARGRTHQVQAHGAEPKPWQACPAQLRHFLTSVASDRYYTFFLLAATTGLRRAELCGLRWTAVDLRRGTLSVEPDTRVVVNGRAQDSDGKTDNAPRLLALDPATMAALRVWQDTQRGERAFFDSDYDATDRVFTWENGRPIHPNVIRQRFHRLSQRCGLPHIRHARLCRPLRYADLVAKAVV